MVRLSNYIHVVMRHFEVFLQPPLHHRQSHSDEYLWFHADVCLQGFASAWLPFRVAFGRARDVEQEVVWIHHWHPGACALLSIVRHSWAWIIAMGMATGMGTTDFSTRTFALSPLL